MTKEEKQRIYDAMLIRAWRKDVTMDSVRLWLKPYNICILDEDLIRTSPYMPQRIVRFVGAQLKPLGDRLFDGNPVDDIKILNWLTKSGLQCKNTERIKNNDMQNIRYAIRKEKKLNELFKNGLENKGEEIKLKVPRRSLASKHF